MADWYPLGLWLGSSPPPIEGWIGSPGYGWADFYFPDYETECESVPALHLVNTFAVSRLNPDGEGDSNPYAVEILTTGTLTACVYVSSGLASCGTPAVSVSMVDGFNLYVDIDVWLAAPPGSDFSYFVAVYQVELGEAGVVAAGFPWPYASAWLCVGVCWQPDGRKELTYGIVVVP